ncbi:hypothetical protein M2368_003413 [Arthrobacter sp. JUb119]|uniref:hypothetical protein n=1 Tax=Arthrobacter sp. JUb115 TaxID=2485108 RepID=UPI001061EA0E|nr:hypothetical protein [Arthrobacter sp. JUb115]MCS3494381.1 hypothetical protein [Arthrobacter sp. JUb119]
MRTELAPWCGARSGGARRVAGLVSLFGTWCCQAWWGTYRLCAGGPRRRAGCWWQLVIGGSSFLGGYRGFWRGGLLVFLVYLLSLVAEGLGGRWFWQVMVHGGFVDSRSHRP